MRGHVQVLYVPSVVRDDHEDVQRLEEQRGHSEEVGCPQLWGVKTPIGPELTVLSACLSLPSDDGRNEWPGTSSY